MTDEDVVRRFAEIIEIGKVTIPSLRPGRKQIYQWRCFGLAAMQHLDQTIGPYLGDRRRGRLDEALAYIPARDGERGRWIEPRVFSDEGLAALRASMERALAARLGH